ncbi:RNA-binding protein 48 isoform X2 [Apodemus sylvaticus]|uniref:RNA-binding protein 48 isoform X2 n=1 Tax=Apodemus sylvaticus TaxID=10129 RepID=UPI002243E906|nr:RNA-binding protein 48 isoform X2 [Apodemus sylvaticus]
MGSILQPILARLTHPALSLDAEERGRRMLFWRGALEPARWHPATGNLVAYSSTTSRRLCVTRGPNTGRADALARSRVAKKRMDEQSFFGGLLHVCYAPEFETVEETRKKLEERKAYIARVTKNQDCYMTKKKPVPEQQGMKDSRQGLHPRVPGFGTAVLDTSPEGPPENASPGLPYSCEFPLGYFASKSTCSPGEHTDRASHSCNSARNHGEPQKHRHHSAFPPKPQMNTYKTQMNASAPCSGMQEAIAASQAVGRFMPRTTQLQERKRRRDCDRELGTNTNSNEVLIGPKLPGIPTVDLQDDSLNTTANLIRNKLKEVISSVPTPPADGIRDVCTGHPGKQRRRI